MWSYRNNRLKRRLHYSQESRPIRRSRQRRARCIDSNSKARQTSQWSPRARRTGSKIRLASKKGVCEPTARKPAAILIIEARSCTTLLQELINPKTQVSNKAITRSQRALC